MGMLTLYQKGYQDFVNYYEMLSYIESVDYIGIIDSGIGGINILNACLETVHGGHFVYLADTLHAPYGNKSPQEIYNHIKECVYFLKREYDVKYIVLGCNTATSCCVDKLRRVLDIPIVGTVPAIRQAIRYMKGSDQVAVLCTCATAKYCRDIDSIRGISNVSIIKKRNWATIIEKHIDDDLDKILHLSRLKKYDKIVLGCTHYSFLKSSPLIGKRMIDGSVGVSKRLGMLLRDYRSKSKIIVYIVQSGNKSGYVEMLHRLTKIKTT